MPSSTKTMTMLMTPQQKQVHEGALQSVLMELTKHRVRCEGLLQGHLAAEERLRVEIDTYNAAIAAVQDLLPKEGDDGEAQ